MKRDIEKVTWSWCQNQATELWRRHTEVTAIYGVPRGGSMVAELVINAAQRDGILLTRLNEHEAHHSPDPVLVVDDLVDSGRTRDRVMKRLPGHLFDTLVTKNNGKWVEFPWEKNESPGEDAVVRLIQTMGEDPSREGLLDTPKRFLKAMKELTAGYSMIPEEILDKTFDLRDADEKVKTGSLILSAPLPFVSLCEHHMLAFDGEAHIGYIPNEAYGRVVGLSKLARLLDCFAKRLQVQERLTSQIANAINDVLKPRAVGVVIRARHTCQCYRGVRKDGRMLTSALLGSFKDHGDSRKEFFDMVALARS